MEKIWMYLIENKELILWLIPALWTIVVRLVPSLAKLDFVHILVEILDRLVPNKLPESGKVVRLASVDKKLRRKERLNLG